MVVFGGVHISEGTWNVCMMMFHAQGSSRNHCSLLAVFCGSTSDCDYKRNHSLSPSDDLVPRYPIPQLSSSGRLEVQLVLVVSLHSAYVFARSQ